MKTENKVLNQIIQSGFYLDIDISEEIALDSLMKIFFGEYSINLYCVNCKEISIFHDSSKKLENKERLNKLFKLAYGSNAYSDKLRFIHNTIIAEKLYPYFVLEFPCVRCNKNIIYCMMLDETKKTVIKIGQYPSIVDLAQDIDKKYEKLLSEEYYREYK